MFGSGKQEQFDHEEYEIAKRRLAQAEEDEKNVSLGGDVDPELRRKIFDQLATSRASKGEIVENMQNIADREITKNLEEYRRARKDMRDRILKLCDLKARIATSIVPNEKGTIIVGGEGKIFDDFDITFPEF